MLANHSVHSELQRRIRSNPPTPTFRYRAFQRNSWGQDPVLEGTEVWQTRHAVAFPPVPPWVSPNSELPSPRELSWHVPQEPIVSVEF
jgi:hypothetical protein